KDYVYRREVMHTGHLLDTNGNQVATICDVTPHAIDPTEGLPLSGKATFGKYTTDDHEDVTLGCLGTFSFYPRKILLALYCVRRVQVWRFLVQCCERFLIIPIYQTAFTA
ncbi:hypothetical protein N9L76_11155, partial [bacterium]|nr:hypothetical protein [bacterium]